MNSKKNFDFNSVINSKDINLQLSTTIVDKDNNLLKINNNEQNSNKNNDTEFASIFSYIKRNSLPSKPTIVNEYNQNTFMNNNLMQNNMNVLPIKVNANNSPNLGLSQNILSHQNQEGNKFDLFTFDDKTEQKINNFPIIMDNNFQNVRRDSTNRNLNYSNMQNLNEKIYNYPYNNKKENLNQISNKNNYFSNSQFNFDKNLNHDYNSVFNWKNSTNDKNEDNNNRSIKNLNADFLNENNKTIDKNVLSVLNDIFDSDKGNKSDINENKMYYRENNSSNSNNTNYVGNNFNNTANMNLNYNKNLNNFNFKNVNPEPNLNNNSFYGFNNNFSQTNLSNNQTAVPLLNQVINPNINNQTLSPNIMGNSTHDTDKIIKTLFEMEKAYNDSNQNKHPKNNFINNKNINQNTPNNIFQNKNNSNLNEQNINNFNLNQNNSNNKNTNNNFNVNINLNNSYKKQTNKTNPQNNNTNNLNQNNIYPQQKIYNNNQPNVYANNQSSINNSNININLNKNVVYNQIQPNTNLLNPQYDEKSNNLRKNNSNEHSFEKDIDNSDSFENNESDVKPDILNNINIFNIETHINNINVYKEPNKNVEKIANDFLCKQLSKGNLHWLISSKDIEREKQIGFGGSSEVYKGNYRGTEVAIKKLIISEVQDENLKEFTREVSSLVMLRHPHLVLFMGAM